VSCKTLKEFGIDNFRDMLREAQLQTLEHGHRNADWFVSLLKDPYNNGKYHDWYIIEDTAFATAQRFGHTFRLLTRYFDFSWYNVYPGRNLEVITPAIDILKVQLDIYDGGFVSLEYMSRKNLIKRMGQRFGKFTQRKWIVPEGMFKTCNNNSKKCWQHITYTGRNPELQSITYEKWNDLPD